ncbi:MAG: response regulator [Campylobacterota bacterium]|nr:response regulator [Campylobacterota bacterium]
MSINLVIVDDENEILSLLERFFSRIDGYKVTTFSNPVTALSRLPEDTDVVLSDVMMPQMNGLDLLPKLLAKKKDLKVVIMTAYSTLDKVLDAHRGGATHYVMKPFDSLQSLQKKIEEVANS